MPHHCVLLQTFEIKNVSQNFPTFPVTHTVFPRSRVCFYLFSFLNYCKVSPPSSAGRKRWRFCSVPNRYRVLSVRAGVDRANFAFISLGTEVSVEVLAFLFCFVQKFSGSHRSEESAAAKLIGLSAWGWAGKTLN